MSATTSASKVDDTEVLLHRCAGGDRMAFRLLYDRWGDRLYGLALRITRQTAPAADATQDAFVQIWQQAHRFDPERGNPEAWLIGIVRYRALDIVRRQSREVPGYEPEEIEDEAPDALARLVSTAEGAALQRCLGELEHDRRRLVVMAFVDGLSHSELAERMRVPLGTVKSWIRRSLISLRGCLAS
ncbi:MAG TPA: sigma-70 family RNA polymerase sigma factor [Acetobacteraceae bacterium]|nr:sigma-70 family RNA polymerase sigma factor [Acetobacteraceae bacterium]